MRTIVLTTISIVVLVVVGGAAFVYLGVFSVAADEPHSAIVYAVMETARVRSIKAHAAGIVAATGYDDEPMLIRAVGHFSAHCAPCHGEPGAKPEEIAQGMYPRPPILTHVSEEYTPPELFWILKHGIKMSAMPSMADDGEPMLWSTVALLQKFPRMSEEDYKGLWLQAKARVNTDHDMDDMDMHGSAAINVEKHQNP